MWVKKDLNMARYYIDLALQGFKDKNLIYPQGDGFWYANVLDSKGEICVLDNDMDEAFKIFTVIADTKDASHEETTFIQMMMNALRIDDSSSSSQSSANPVIINAPSNAINTDSHKWEVVSVEVRDDCTYLYKRVSPKTSSTYVLSYTDEYIEDANTGEKYYLTDSSILVYPQKTILSGTAPRDFIETYPALPASVKYINISSGSEYYVKNLKIR